MGRVLGGQTDFWMVEVGREDVFISGSLLLYEATGMDGWPAVNKSAVRPFVLSFILVPFDLPTS